MKLKDLIEQEEIIKPFTTEISVVQAIDWIKKNSSNYASRFGIDKAIWRGMSGVRGLGQYGDSTKFNRKSSSGTKNYYTLIIDSSDRWKKYPKRSKSFICSTNQQSAKSFGPAFCVFPKDTLSVGICPSYDMWDSFFNKLKDIDINDLNHLNGVVAGIGNNANVVLSETDPIALRAVLRTLTLDKLNEIPKSGYGSHIPDIIEYMEIRNLNNLEEFFEFIIDPDDAKFEIQDNIGNFDWKPHLEIWFSGEAVFIPESWLSRSHSFYEQFAEEFGLT